MTGKVFMTLEKKEEYLVPVKESDMQRKARAKALRLLEHMDRTEKALSEKLLCAGFSEEDTAEAIRYVKSFGYLSDMHYAEVYIRGRLHTKSRQQIFQELQKKGVERDVIRKAWDAAAELEEPDEHEVIRRELLKKYGEGSELDDRELRRLQGYFARRGFRYEDVSAVMRELEIHRKKEEVHY